ncbi:uncharacterized protein LOC133658135 [Entelurus aequoreus]|uniref:uncharacterized protein LOC133658135 n=1 Tax=Entelurus aequoreus TaxID=161455 RepID=UPI002B1E672F|nr:uncharacterized protein LOC133658135 [Entelurus aequoreus]
MPPFSTEDYHKLLQKILLLEIKMNRLEVNLEVNGQCGNNTTLALLSTENTGQHHATTQLTSNNEATKKREVPVEGNKSTSENPPWNTLGAKPKRRPPPCDKGEWISGRTQRPDISDLTGWPALPSSARHTASSTPLPRRTQQRTAEKRRTTNKPPQQASVQLKNRFAPLLMDNGSPSDCLNNPPSPRRRDMVSDMEKRILEIVAAHPNVKNIILHIGFNDIVKQQSRELKEHFNKLFETVSAVNADVFISGPLPPIRRGAERFSRLYSLNEWLSSALLARSMHFIDNFSFFWDRRHLFKADGLCLNKMGVKLFMNNMFHFLHLASIITAKDKRQEEPPRKEDTTQPIRNVEGGPPLQKENVDHEIHQSKEERCLSSSTAPPSILNACEDPSPTSPSHPRLHLSPSLK